MKLNALVVDDSRTARAIIIKTLRLTGLEWGELHEAAQGREALVKLADHWIDLILTDIHMPEMNGLELIEQLGRDGVLNSVPVIVTSTDGNRDQIERLQQKGVRAYLRKPFTPEAACEAILSVLQPESG
jgi:two-component system, chemotaxis family, chemotaxis protein CheY